MLYILRRNVTPSNGLFCVRDDDGGQTGVQVEQRLSKRLVRCRQHKFNEGELQRMKIHSVADSHRLSYSSSSYLR